MPIIASRASAAYGAGFGKLLASGGVWSPEGAYDSLATADISSTTASITFSAIPDGYKHLQIRMLCLGNSGSTQDAYIRFNGDSGSNYAYHAMYGEGSSISAYGYASQAFGKLGVNGAGNNSLSSGTAFPAMITDIVDYSDVSKYKTLKTLCGFDTNAASTNINNETVSISSALWLNTSAITSIQIYPSGGSWLTNSSFALYGVK